MTTKKWSLYRYHTSDKNENLLGEYNSLKEAKEVMETEIDKLNPTALQRFEKISKEKGNRRIEIITKNYSIAYYIE